VTPLIAQFHGPADWTWIIACDEAAWHRVEQHIGKQDSVGGLTLGTTDLENHVTYVRGFYVLHPFSYDDMAQADHTIAHELGHITLNTHNEATAERKAQELLSGQLVAKARNVALHPNIGVRFQPVGVYLQADWWNVDLHKVGPSTDVLH
jgi:hypothetical protein